MEESSFKTMLINVNHSPRAQDLALHTARENNVDVLVITEPYVTANNVFSAPEWTFEVNSRCAILLKPNITHSFHAVITDNICVVGIESRLTIIATYCSPNQPFSPMLEALTSILRNIDAIPTLVLGDFNCATSLIRNVVTNPRGVEFEEFLVLNNLRCDNPPGATWFRGDLSSTTDYICSRHCDRVTVRIAENVTLSDHRYIFGEVDISAVSD